jgi:GNAT superfamily N-acetyltransferase
MEPADAEAVYAVSLAAFHDLDVRLGGRPEPPGPGSGAAHRVGRLQRTDPGGAWVAERDGEIVGGALGIVREGVWGLSLLVVRPDAQSSGAGRELLARAYEYGNGGRGWIVLASRDPRALRAYARLGLDLHPAMSARGEVSQPAIPGRGGPRPDISGGVRVRPGTADDLSLTEAVDRAVRGSAHGEDVLALLEAGSRLLVLPERGYAPMRGAELRLLAAFDDESAATLLRGCLADVAGQEAAVDFITSAQNWAVAPCVAAGLELRSDGGAVFLAGEVGPFAPYLPSGAYL